MLSSQHGRTLPSTYLSQVLQLIERERLGLKMAPKCWCQPLQQPSDPLSIMVLLLRLQHIRVELVKAAATSLVVLNTLFQYPPDQQTLQSLGNSASLPSHSSHV